MSLWGILDMEIRIYYTELTNADIELSTNDVFPDLIRFITFILCLITFSKKNIILMRKKLIEHK